MESGFVNANGANHYFEVLGQGTPLVLIHGGFMDCRMWDAQFSTFAKQYRVIRYDVRGHGKSDRPREPFAYEEDLHALLSQLNIGRAHLVGHSLGGLIAINYALQFPAKVSGLVLVGSGLSGFQFSQETLAPFSEGVEAVRNGEYSRFADIFIRVWVVGPTRNPDDVQTDVKQCAREMILHNLQRPVEWNLTGREPDAISRLPEIQIPTLIITAENDVADIARIAELISANVAGAKRAEIKHAAHLMNMEQREVFERVVLDFLAQ